MTVVLEALQRNGQIMSAHLAELCRVTERTVHTNLYPHVVSGAVMACKVFGPDNKLIGTEYRLSGTYPKARPGPKVGGKQHKTEAL